MASAFGTAAAGSAASTSAATAAAAGTAAATTTGFTVASLIPSAATAAWIGTGLSVLASVRQGQAAEVQSEIQAERIKRDASQRELNRRRRLVASLASQNATRAASGIAAFEGSSQNIMLEDIRQGEASFLTERAGAADAAQSVLDAGQFARRTSFINAGASLLDQFDRTLTRG